MSPIRPIPDVPEPPRLSRSVGLGRLAENSLVRFAAQLFNRAKDGIAELIRNALERLLESLEKPLASMVGDVLDDTLATPGMPASVRKVLFLTRNPRDPVAIGGLLIAVGTVILYFVPAALSGVIEKVRQISWLVTRPHLLDFPTWYAASLRDPANRAEMENDLKGQGWRDNQIVAARLAAERRLGVSEILMATHRGEFDTAQATERMKALGIPFAEISVLLRLSDQIPGPSDLVRFALREAWRDDVAQKYGYDQGRVREFDDWLEKQGYGAEWAQAYWRSHWVVPSVGQGFEMMHRDIISESELVELLKVNDIAPGWIPGLMAMARPVPGRIDRRWAYQEGEITESQLYDLYKQDGYDDFWAGVLSATVVKRSVSEAKGLTRSAIVAAYTKRRITSNEAVGLLEDIGIPSAVAQFYLGQADDDREDDLLDRRISVVARQYRASDLDENATRDALGQLGVGSAEIAVYLEEWGIARVTKVKRPTRSNLDKFFLGGIITIEAYRDQMARLGYSDLYVDWYLAALAVDRQHLAEKDERDARGEADRVARDRRKTDYQVAKARIDVDIAELNAAIASAQVALIEAQNERDKRLARALPAASITALEREYQPLLFDAEAAIDEARLQVTRLQADIKAKREAISLVDRSLIENVDMSKFAGLKADRLKAQTEQARLGEIIAKANVDIAGLKSRIPILDDPDKVAKAELDILGLQVEVAEHKEKQAAQLSVIEKLDEAMAEALSPVRRAELQSEKAALQVEIAGLESDIAELREEVKKVQGDREQLKRELDGQITALPGAEAQIAIRAAALVQISEIQSNIATYRENIAQLRLEKSRLAVEWRK